MISWSAIIIIIALSIDCSKMSYQKQLFLAPQLELKQIVKTDLFIRKCMCMHYFFNMSNNIIYLINYFYNDFFLNCYVLECGTVVFTFTFMYDKPESNKFVFYIYTFFFN